MRIPFPKEHGAYGQIAFPLIAAFGVGGASTAGVFFAAVVIALFLAHEPVLILLGHRGPRARREQWRSAATWLALLVLVGGAAAVGTLRTFPSPVSWALLVPVPPAIVLAGATLFGAEKSMIGETSMSLTASSAAVPIVTAPGAPPDVIAAVLIPFALLFVSNTLAVRAVILDVRGSGNRKAASIARWMAGCVALGGGGWLLFGSIAQGMPWRFLAATAPGLITAIAITVWRPSPSRLRALGWALIAVAALTAIIVVVTNRSWPSRVVI